MAARKPSKGKSPGSKPGRAAKGGAPKKPSTKTGGGRIGGEIVKKKRG